MLTTVQYQLDKWFGAIHPTSGLATTSLCKPTDCTKLLFRSDWTPIVNSWMGFKFCIFHVHDNYKSIFISFNSNKHTLNADTCYLIHNALHTIKLAVNYPPPTLTMVQTYLTRFTKCWSGNRKQYVRIWLPLLPNMSC